MNENRNEKCCCFLLPVLVFLAPTFVSAIVALRCFLLLFVAVHFHE